jgi:hypothetical protein
MFNCWSRRTTVGALSAMLLLGSLSAAAENRCEARVRKAEHNLEQAVRQHGEHSRQAEKRRAELERARANCHR